MQHTVIALFDNYSQAEAARDALVKAGFDGDGIALRPRCEPTYASDATSAANAPPHSKEGVLAEIERFFEALFVSTPLPHEVAQYAEAVRRGAIMLSADAATETQAELARSLLERSGAIDIDERAPTWRAPDDETARAQSPLEELGIRRAAIARQRGPVRSYRRSTRPGATVDPGGEEVAARPASEAAVTAAAAGSAPGMGAIFTAGRSATPSASPAAKPGATTPSAPHSTADTATSRAAAPIPDEFLQYEEDFHDDDQAMHARDVSRNENYEDTFHGGVTLGRGSRYGDDRAWRNVEPHGRQDWKDAHAHHAWERIKIAVRHGWERVTHHGPGA